MRPLRRVKRWALDGLTVARFGTLHPQSVVLPGSERPIHFDSRDRRARKKLVWESLRGRIGRNRRVWCAAAARLAPTLVVDVGLNYGECLFSADYPDALRVVGVEANPALIRYAERTAAGHPQRRVLRIVNALAGAHGDGEGDFYVNREWSGGSTPVAGVAERAPERFRVARVPTVTVDALFADAAADDARLLFKIDVEGYEAQVLRGMSGLLGRCRCAVGYVEFDARFLVAAGTDLTEYAAALLERFAVYRFGRRGGLARVIDGRELHGDDRAGLHTDLLLVAGLDAAREAALLDGIAG